jgi:hypothetical protein
MIVGEEAFKTALQGGLVMRLNSLPPAQAFTPRGRETLETLVTAQRNEAEKKFVGDYVNKLHPQTS